MKSIDLLRAINDIDDKYIEEAMPLAYKKEKHFGILRYMPAFFGLVLVAVVGVRLINMNAVDDNVQVVNPLTEYNSLFDAEESVGFKLGIDLSDYDNLSYVVINNEILEITYSDSDNNLILRKAKGSEDISGDFNTYDVSDDVSVNGVDVSIDQSGNNILVRFVYDGYSYSLSSNYLDSDQMLEFVESIVK